MMPRRDTQSGFSLLETLLGLTLTAIIGMLMMGSFQMGARVWARDRVPEKLGVEQLLLGQTGEWLSQAMPAKIRSTEDPAYAPFTGDARVVNFEFASPSMAGTPGIYAVTLELVAGEGCPEATDLMLRTVRLSATSGEEDLAPARVDSRRLLSCVPGASFVFWDGLAVDRAEAWIGEWQEKTYLPGVVRLRSIDASGGERAILTQRIVYAER
jgi:hypothetical protein